MLRFILKPRSLLILPTFLGITFVAFFAHPPAAGRSGRGDGRRARHLARAPCRADATSSASTSRSGSSTRLSRRRPARRLRHLLRHQRAGAARVHDAASRRPSNCRSAPCSSPSSLGIPAGIIAAAQARLGIRPARHGHRAHRLLHADLLVGAAAHHPLLGASSTGRRSPGRIELLYYFPSRSPASC